jgi:hypothetical protein
MFVLLGGWFLAVELLPRVQAFAYGARTWPLQIIGIGAMLGLLALLLWVPGLWIPACIVAGTGGLLYWQNSTGNWASWSYAWALIICCVGLGILLTGAASRSRKAAAGGGWVLFYGLVLFAVFGAFLGGLDLLQRFWPVLLVVLGMILLSNGLARRKPPTA